MKRRIIKQGTATMTMSLPSSWVQKYNLQNGDELDVQEKNNFLIIKNDKNAQIESKTIYTKNLHPLIYRTIRSNYILGHDEIKLVTNDISKINLNDFQQLIGMEAVDKTDKNIVLRDITNTSLEQFDNMYRRLFLILKGTIEEGKDIKKINELLQKENDINRVSNICLRLLNKKGYDDYKRIPVLYYVISKIEEVGDEYKMLFKFVSEKKVKLDSNSLNIYLDIQELFNKCYDFSFSFKKETAVDIANYYDQTKQKLSKCLDDIEDKNQIKVLFHLKAILEKVIFIQGSQLGFVGDD